MERMQPKDLKTEKEAEDFVESLLKEEREHRLPPGTLERAAQSDEYKQKVPKVWEALCKKLRELGRLPPEEK